MRYKVKLLKFFIIVITAVSALKASDNDKWNRMAGSAFLDNASGNLLERLCFEAGGRLAGSQSYHKAMDILEAELKALGIASRRESFTMPGWDRGDDHVIMTEPVNYELRASALGYTGPSADIHSTPVYVKNGTEDDYKGLDVKGKIVIANQGLHIDGQPFMRCEAIEIAAKKGAAAVLFINEKNGGLLLFGIGSYNGNPTPIPAFTITVEEGARLQGLIEKKVKTELTIITKSHCTGNIKEENMVVTFPGKSKKKIVVGAHFDSWDISQGAVDNGFGTAIIFELARLIKVFSPDNELTLEFVWFNSEETGMWGSRRYVEMHKDDDITLMINLDMTGIPTGFNVMGFDELTPFFTDMCTNLNGFNLKNGVNSVPWNGSDHMPFILKGIPSVNVNADLDKDMHWYYHDYGDTFDKVRKNYLSQAAAVLSVVITELANRKDIVFPKKSSEEVKSMLIKHKLDSRLKIQQMWPFGG